MLTPPSKITKILGPMFTMRLSSLRIRFCGATGECERDIKLVPSTNLEGIHREFCLADIHLPRSLVRPSQGSFQPCFLSYSFESIFNVAFLASCSFSTSSYCLCISSSTISTASMIQLRNLPKYLRPLFSKSAEGLRHPTIYSAD
jgi:hypothetical protein